MKIKYCLALSVISFFLTSCFDLEIEDSFYINQNESLKIVVNHNMKGHKEDKVQKDTTYNIIDAADKIKELSPGLFGMPGYIEHGIKDNAEYLNYTAYFKTLNDFFKQEITKSPKQIIGLFSKDLFVINKKKGNQFVIRENNDLYVNLLLNFGENEKSENLRKEYNALSKEEKQENIDKQVKTFKQMGPILASMIPNISLKRTFTINGKIKSIKNAEKLSDNSVLVTKDLSFLSEFYTALGKDELKLRRFIELGLESKEELRKFIGNHINKANTTLTSFKCILEPEPVFNLEEELNAIKIDMMKKHYEAKAAREKQKALEDAKNAAKLPKSESVIIGKQEWKTSNLNTETFQNGDTIEHIEDDKEWQKAAKEGIPAWCYYDNSQEYGRKYGMLYNWYAVSDERGLCPKGWHVPNEEEWKALGDFLGIDTAGYKMRTTYEWGIKDDGIGDNSSGFYGLSGGVRGWMANNSTKFTQKELGGYWWGTDEKYHIFNKEKIMDKAFRAMLSCNFNKLTLGRTFKSHGLSVRCIKN